MKKSKQPRKQRKELYTKSLHKKRKLLSATLSKDLKKTHGKKNIPLRKDDVVTIMRGKYKGKSGKVTKVSLKNAKIQVEKIGIKKGDGSEKPHWLQPSNVMITELKLEDKERIKVLARK